MFWMVCFIASTVASDKMYRALFSKLMPRWHFIQMGQGYDQFHLKRYFWGFVDIESFCMK